MDEYIEKEAMRTIIREQESKHGLRGMAWVEMAMDRHPAADVVPVRHGRWEWHEEHSNSTTEHYVELESCGWHCSHCGIELGDYLTKRIGETIYLDDESRKPFLNRCPNCGWIMDLEDEGHG